MRQELRPLVLHGSRNEGERGNYCLYGTKLIVVITRITFPAILLAFMTNASAQPARVELLASSGNPSASECTALAAHNSSIQSGLVAKHGACLNASPATREDYLGAEPCSSQSCRPIHLQMDWVRDQILAINKDCQSRIPKKQSITSRQDSDSSQSAVSMLAKADDLVSRATTAVELVRNRDQPWSIAEMAWGEGAGRVRRELANRVSGGSTKANANWETYDLLFNKAYDKNIELAQAARNPVARLINEAMLSRLYVVHADIFGQLQATLSAIDSIGATAPALPAGSRMPPVFYPSPRGVPSKSGKSSAGDVDCLVLSDTNRSSALLTADANAWLELSDRCNGARR